MQLLWVVPAVILVVTVGCVLLLLRRLKTPTSTSAKALKLNAEQSSPAEVTQAVPSQIAIVDATARPLVTIQAIESSDAFDKAQPVDHGNGSISRLSALVQAAPSVMVAASASGKQLMEVVVNGELVRSADGNGLRAIAMGPNGIKEHARLFEVKNLENMINAAAVWQIASVVVAQKHLADISKKLDEIKLGVQNLARFQDQQRRSRIEGTYEYLGQAYLAIKGGELPKAVRVELESCERDLAEIQGHLAQDYRDLVSRKVEHKETFGTGELSANIENKIDSLGKLGRDLELAVKTRIAAWHVLALYPGETQLKAARRMRIEESIADVEALVPELSHSLSAEIAGVKSMWNWESTLAERRANLKTKLNSTREMLTTAGQLARGGIAASGELLLEHDQPTRMWLEVENGVVVGARREP
ncbi:hypothetical protein [Ralstonia pickettii]|uniref:hypothetical protein n=1 Tax=Ralstonia pickettii TaxID=329 RepID=UPI0015BE7F73|nr:hypothetical protein [Ralstonia pickettii]NWK46424.1 hypothetical protein [Ralstonia pickettii]